MKYFVLHGAAGSARYSVAEDTYVRQRNHVIAIIDQLARDRQIAAFPAPAISGYQHVTRILSDHLGPLVFDDGGDIRKGLGKLQGALARASRRRR
ncbi:hypothetical protein ACFSHT_16320 [Paraburkholderia silviterrae]|uniref:Uncharacterized protein n=1 Tax=Paraburkholderia silviterrae TaxID=2528715 RepID=A0A4R5M963_9BURK|nr:hypothetical protein [Paraburkholderia silviterrae]TDG23149.1 hypothetical protein EYW47_14500 [Paraburkholderia silviterrae]